MIPLNALKIPQAGILLLKMNLATKHKIGTKETPTDCALLTVVVEH